MRFPLSLSPSAFFSPLSLLPDRDCFVIYFGANRKILFRDVLAAIRDYAFSTSEFPLILSLENHCSVHQQEVMADVMLKVLGDLLCKESLPGKDGSTVLPSPHDLRRKILLKGKALPKGILVASLISKSALVAAEELDDDDEESDSEIPDLKSELPDDPVANPSDHKGVNRKLSDITVYCQTKNFKSFSHSRENHHANEVCFSFYTMLFRNVHADSFFLCSRCPLFRKRNPKN